MMMVQRLKVKYIFLSVASMMIEIEEKVLERSVDDVRKLQRKSLRLCNSHVIVFGTSLYHFTYQDAYF